MLLTPHTLVGVTIATAVGNPLLAFPISVGMHFMGDLVPHWDFYSHTTKEERMKGWRPMAVMADLALGIGVGCFFTFYALWVKHEPMMAFNIFLCGIGSVLPDLITGPSIYIEGVDSIFEFVHKIQSKLQIQAPLPWGVISQAIVSGICLLLISSLIR